VIEMMQARDCEAVDAGSALVVTTVESQDKAHPRRTQRGRADETAGKQKTTDRV
jgi:hypothetical protein